MKKRILALLLCVVMIVAFSAGCGKKGGNTASELKSEFGEGIIEYPLKTDESVSVWIWLNSNLLKSCSTRADALGTKAYEEASGVKIDWIHPAVGQEDQAFNLLFSSSDLPDIICNGSWKTFPGGGPDGAIESGYILDLTDLLPKYAPNYWAALQADPELAKEARSPKGRYYDVGSLPHTLPVYGMIVREDWLKDLDLEVPETISDWYTVLKAFKEEKGAQSPLAFTGGTFIYKQDVLTSAFDTTSGYYLDGDKVKFGPMNKGWKDFVKEMAKWYKEGLIDVNIASSDHASFEAQLLNNKTGATMGYTSSGIGKYMASKSADSPMVLVAAPYPVMKKGEAPEKYGKKTSRYSNMSAISATCKNPELALRWLDFAFTERGRLLHAYGVEGTSFEMKNGKPEYTDTFLKNPDGLSVSEALHYYASAALGSIGDGEAFRKQLTTQQEVDSTTIWKVSEKHCIPTLVVDPEDQDEYGDIMVEVDNYVAETTLKIICGQLPLSTLDNMNKELKKLNIERAIEIQQKAFNAYNK